MFTVLAFKYIIIASQVINLLAKWINQKNNKPKLLGLNSGDKAQN